MADDSGSEDDNDRDAILMRRRRFVALALAGLTAPTVAACDPEPCLNVTPVPCLEPTPCLSPPMPCLSPIIEEPDAQSAGAGEQDAGEGGGGGLVQPQVCLEFAPPAPGEVDDEGNPRG